MKLYRKQVRVYYDGETNWDPDVGPRTEWYFEEDSDKMMEELRTNHSSLIMDDGELYCSYIQDRYIEYESDKKVALDKQVKI